MKARSLVDWRSWRALPGRLGDAREQRSARLRVALTQAAFLAVALPGVAFRWFDESVLAIIPVGVAAWSYGRRAGLAAAAFDTLVVVVITHATHGFDAFHFYGELLPWAVVLTLVGFYVGELSELLAHQHRTAAELARSRALLARTLDGTDRAIAYFDAEGRLLHGNEAYFAAHGTTPAKALGKRHEEAFGCREHGAVLERFLRQGRAAARQEDPVTCMQPRAGATTYWTWTLQALQAGEERGAILTLEDVTEQRQMRLAREAAEQAVRESEARFHQVADNVDDVIFLITADLQEFVYLNPAYERITGYPITELREAPGAWLARLSDEDREAMARALGERVLRGESADVEIRIPRPDGTVAWGLIKAFPVKDERGEVYRVAGIMHDVTERRAAAERALREERHLAEIAKLKEIAAFKTTFLNTAAHELATPITPLQFELDVLREGWSAELNDEQKEAVGILQRSVERLSVLIHDLLDAARLESGRLRVRLSRVDLRSVVAEAARPFERVAGAAGVRLDVERGAPVPVDADAGRVAQVVTNLVDNALKYTPAGGEVRVAVDGEGGEARVRVTDTGRGLTAEQIGRLFQPFMQVHPEGPFRGSAGTGLGLFISRGIVEAHGGRIWCDSKGAGAGSTFGFSLPLAAPQGAASAGASAGAVSALP